MRLAFSALALGIILAGCGDKTPAKLETGTYPAAVFDNKPFKLTPSVLNKSGELIPDTIFTYQASPAGIAEVSSTGEVRCAASGDTTILVNGGGQSAMATIKCRLVSKIDVPPNQTIIMGKNEADFRPQALNEKGEVIADATIEGKSADQNVVRVESGRLVPVAIGKTFVTYSAGSITTTMDVAVARFIAEGSGPLVLADGQVRTISLPKGNFAIEIMVSPQGGGRGQGVDVTATGAQCGQPERNQHRFQCIVADAAALTISNPTAFGLGAGMTGFLNIYELPPM